jgi:hypothetical protein
MYNGLKQGEALLPLVLNLALECVIIKEQRSQKQKQLKLKKAQLLVTAVYLMWDIPLCLMHTIKC